MGLKTFRILVTGGAGFIGSHLVDHLMELGCKVKVLDNLSYGSLGNLKRWLKNKRFRFVKGDLKKSGDVMRGVDGVDLIFHLAANPEVRVGETDPTVHFRENLVATFNLLEAMRRSESAKTLVFASTSTVYGEAKVLPTPEDYGPSVPISTYGASKLGCEALAFSYAHTFGLRVLVLRFANVVGSRAAHNVLFDFVRKLEADPKRLEILGDGTQKKSYLHIEDCINAILCATDGFLRSEKKIEAYNVGSVDQLRVNRIAEIVVKEMDLKDVKFVFTGGVKGGRGWLGDVKYMHLSVDKLMKLGWKPKYDSEGAVKLAVREILKERHAR